MDSKDSNMGDNAVDWNDPMFANTQFEDAMPADSPYGVNSTFDAYTNYNDMGDSPGGLTMRRTSKAPFDFASTPSHHMHLLASRSNESSSQDSASDTSSSRKRKTTSESPASDAPDGDKSRLVMKGDTLVDLNDKRHIKSRSKHTSHRLSQTMTNRSGMFELNSTASSPINPGAFDAALSLDEQVHGIMMPPNHSGFAQASPIQTINPATFGYDGSRDHSPATNNVMFSNSRSPRALFSSTPSDTNEAFAGQAWTPNVPGNATWPGDFNAAAFTSPGALHFTPSPTAASLTMSSIRRSSGSPNRSRLNIAPISTKSRVETQISIVMTLETPPPNIEYLHLPLQTIAKSKLLAKEEVDPARVLELHTMLVCTSAMRNPQHKAKALRRAAAQNNLEIQRRAEAQRETSDEEKNDPKNIADDEKPSNGGEVRICSNCIQRERKRAARKKLKKEEEQQHWERYETERVVVFNSNELLPFKAWEPTPMQPKDTMQAIEEYSPPEGAIQVSAAMRIACYCRHQNEKEGFQVIFTLKDADGNVVAQEMSDSILITDDHKTHPPNYPSNMQEQVMYGSAPMYGAPGLSTSYSMGNIAQHQVPGFTSSRSAGNLQAMAYGDQYNTHSHLHQMHQPGFASGTTSASMTPTNSLSRPGSPTSAGNSGPNKKRKSSSFHRKVPSGLAMTPRVETGVAPTSAANSAVSMMSQFSPNTSGSAMFMGQQDAAFGNVPGNFVPSGPTTPSENLQYVSQQLAQVNSRNGQPIPDYYQSLPGSRVNSRAPSPVMQSNRPNLAAVARQMGQGSGVRGQMYQQNLPSSSTSEADASNIPMIHKITPTEGPVSGGTEVSIYGRDFAQGMQVFFGDQAATAVTFYGDQALLCTSPPGRVGGVQVTVLPVGQLPQYSPSQMTKPVFTYKNANEKVMEMALRFVSQQQTGNSGAWWQVTQQNANMWMQQGNNSGAANNRPGFGNFEGNMFTTEPAVLEKMLTSVLKRFDLSGLQDPSVLDMNSITGQTPLTLASAAGKQDVVKALLSRGANPDGRDLQGFTPLMHAAAHSQLQVFKMLVAKGADPAMRSLSGFTALEVAPADSQAKLQQLLWSTPRSRGHYRLRHRKSSASLASSEPSWDISSASMYESESCSKPSPPASHHAGMNKSADADEVDKADDRTVRKLYTPLPKAVLALKDSLTLQAHHIHKTLHRSVAHLNITLRPSDLEEHQHHNALLRRLATIVYALHETLPYLPLVPLDESLPPAYDDLFPEKQRISSDGIDYSPAPPKTKLICSVCKDRQADQLFDLHVEYESHECSMNPEQDARMASQVVFWLCVPLLVILTAAILHAFGALPSLLPAQAQIIS